MRLAREQEEERPPRVVQQSRQTWPVAQQERCALVGREATCETDREHIRSRRIKKACHVPALRGTQALAQVLALHALAHARQHLRLDRLPGLPKAVIGQRFDQAPEIRVAQTLAPIRGKRAVEVIRPGLMQESRHVHAVRHEADWIFFRWNLRPLIGAQPRRHAAMDAADAVDVPGAVQRQARHVEKTR